MSKRRTSILRDQSMRIAVPLAAAVLGLPALALGGTRTQTFDTAPANWVGFNNDGPTVNYGFSATNNTGQTGGGEAGGLTSRRGPARSWYADTNIGGTLDPDDAFSGSGELFYANGETADTGLRLAHFDTSQVDFNRNVVGFNVLEGTPDKSTGFRFSAYVVDSAGNQFRSERVPHPYKDEGGNQILYKYDYSWDPATDSLTANLRMPDGTIVDTQVALTVNNPFLNATFTGFSLDAFGMTAAHTDSADHLHFDVFTDNVTYTTVDGALAGDFNGDAVVNATDIDLLCDRINAGTGPVAPFDVNNDGSVNQADVNFEVTNILETKFGDTDTDGDVDLNDLGNLATGFNVPGEKRWSRGNFDCDLDVDLPDLGTLATNFDAGRAAALSAFEALVPEPSALSLLGLAAAGLCRRSRRS